MKHRTGYLLKRGSNFYVQWRVNGKAFMKALRDENGQPITTKREAEEAKAKLMAPFTVATEAEVLESIAGRLEGRKAELAKFESESNPPMTLAQAWGEYLACNNRPDTGPDTLAVYEGQFGQFVDWMKEKHQNATALCHVTPETADEYAGYLNHGRLNPSTFNKHIRVLELVFRVLKRKARLEENPWEDIQRKKLETASRRELTLDELKKVCQGAVGELRCLFALGVYSGLRLRDCASLRWGEVDLAQGLIRRVPSKTARRNPKPVIIPIHPSLRTLLNEIPQTERSDFVLPKTAQLYLSGGAGKKRVIDSIQDHFTSQGVRIYKPGTGPGTGKRAVVEVGFHSLRHSFVSMCRASNVPLSVVESLVGHSNPAMTRHYTHTGELAAERAVAGLPSVTGENKPEPKKRDAEGIISEAVGIAQSITAKNWREKKAALIALLNGTAESGQPTLKTQN